MDSPNKRPKTSPTTTDDFVPLGIDDDEVPSRFGYTNEQALPSTTSPPPNAPQAPKPHPRRQPDHRGTPRYDRLHARDRPKSAHALPGHEPWVLVKTKLGRRFVHNERSKESFWYVPEAVWPAVREFEEGERERGEKAANARWAEEQLRGMREEAAVGRGVGEGVAGAGIGTGVGVEKARRRRSESMQREDEEAVMRELAAAEVEEGDGEGKEGLRMLDLEPKVGEMGYDSEDSYEYVEVTDDEGEEGAEAVQDESRHEAAENQAMGEDDTGPVEFGEDDIAYQLAAMGEDYGLDPEDYGGEEDDHDSDDATGLEISDEDAANLFRDLLDDHAISPFTPWDTLITSASPDSILHDDRYTVLPTTRARKAVWTVWARDKAAELADARARTEVRDPRIAYLAFLHQHASPKLYWPEFKRKFKKVEVMNDRKLADKDRERLYRDHVARLKLPEATRKADLLLLLKSVPLRDLNRGTALGDLPQSLLSHLHFVSLPAALRDRVVGAHIATLPAAS